MSPDVYPDPDSEFGKRVRQRLQHERLIWLTTVGADGTPQPNPVWFVWDGANVLVYNRPQAHRLTHIRSRAQVCAHLDGNGRGGDIVILTGQARLLSDHPLPHELPSYLGKYRDSMIRVSGTPESFSQEYPTAVHIVITRVRGF